MELNGKTIIEESAPTGFLYLLIIEEALILAKYLRS
jgi:hypothetical protein